MTGFEAFADHADNPSLQLMEYLDASNHIKNLYCLKLPVIFQQAAAQLLEKIQLLQPDVVLCLGYAANRHVISLERVAINLDDASIPDNMGQQPIDQSIIPHGQNAYFSSLPIKAIYQALKDEQIPCEISYSAGTYVCNHVFYHLMHMVHSSHSNITAGFIHIPAFSTAQLSLKQQCHALQIIIKKCVETCL